VFRIYGPGPKIVDQNLENAPAGENEVTLLGREESLGGRFRIGVALGLQVLIERATA
jgi:hypothetical protein